MNAEEDPSILCSICNIAGCKVVVGWTTINAVHGLFIECSVYRNYIVQHAHSGIWVHQGHAQIMHLQEIHRSISII